MNWRLSFWKKLLANSHTHNVLRSGIHINIFIYIYIFMPRTWRPHGSTLFWVCWQSFCAGKYWWLSTSKSTEDEWKKKVLCDFGFAHMVVRSRAAMLACRVDVNTRTKNALERTLTLLYWHDNIVWGFASFRFFRKHIAVAILECWVATGMFLSWPSAYIYSIYILICFLYM